MVIDRVDDRDHPIGTVARSDVFKEKANFRVVHVLIFDTSGKLLIQRLAPNRERHPLKWGSSVASYLPAGQSYVTAAKARIKDELGITQATLSELGKTVMNDSGSLKFITVFTCIDNGPFTIDKSHIAEIHYASVQDLLSMARENKLTPTLVHILSVILTGL